MSRNRRIAALALAVALTASASAQEPQDRSERPRFRGGVELVQLDVSVLDRDRRPVSGLTAADFTVLENGRERPIRAFTPVRLPPRPDPQQRGSAALRSDVATNDAARQDGRLVFILVDRTIPDGEPTLTAKRIAVAAIETLGPTDLAAVITTGAGVPQTLTADRTRLIAAVNSSDWSTGISKEQEDIIGKEDPLSDGRCLCGLCVLETITRISDAVRHVPRRRKLLLFIGSRMIFQVGFRAPASDVECTRRVSDAQRAAFASLALSNVTVHSFDPGGLANIGQHTRAGAPGGKPSAIDAQVIRRQRLLSDTADFLSDQNSLQVLPELTGGRAVMNTNQPERDIAVMFDETESYYLLAFEPATPLREAEKRKVEVRVRRDGVRVHSQRQYAVPALGVVPPSAPAAAVPVELQRTVQGPLANPDRPLTMALAAFAGAGSAKPLVTINVDVGAFALPDGAPVSLDFAVSALNRFGQQVMSARQTSVITFRPGAFTEAVEANVQTHLELEPGDYEIRLGVSDPARRVTASVYSEITVPRYARAPLALSDVTFEATGHGTHLATAPGTTTRRVFGRAERARAILQVYQGTQSSDPLRPVAVRVRITDPAGRAVRDRIIDLSDREFTDRRASVAADIHSLPAGDYVLTFRARTGDLASERAVPFSVR